MGHVHDAPAGGSRSALARQAGRKALTSALLLTVGYMAVEVAGGVVTNSLALISDAAHMFTDAIALGLGLLGIWIADQPATQHKTYGYHRAEIIVALVNGLIL